MRETTPAIRVLTGHDAGSRRFGLLPSRPNRPAACAARVRAPRNHSGCAGRLRRFATALLIALAAAASGVPAFAQSPPFTAQFENAPASHNGAAKFWVDIRFSEAVDLSFKAFKDNGLLTFTGVRCVTRDGWREAATSGRSR